jgi:hypothetical protein
MIIKYIECIFVIGRAINKNLKDVENVELKFENNILYLIAIDIQNGKQ